MENRLNKDAVQPLKPVVAVSPDKKLKQRWTILNKVTNKFAHIGDTEFNKLLKSNCLTLTGKFITFEIEGLERKVWIDATVKEEYLPNTEG